MKFHEIADLVMNASPAGQTEVLAMEQDESLTRFANNFVHQNVTELNAQVTVRSVIGTRVGIAVSNDTRHDSLKRLAARAYEVAKLQPENPEFKGLPRPLPIRHVESGVHAGTPRQKCGRDLPKGRRGRIFGGGIHDNLGVLDRSRQFHGRFR